MRDFQERPRTSATTMSPEEQARREEAAAYAARKDALRAAIRSDADLTFAEKLVGLRLVDLVNKDWDNTAWPSAPTLADHVGCSTRTVWSAIKKLEGRHFDRELSGPGRHNVYRPRWPDEQEQEQDPVKQASCPREAGFMPPVKHGSREIVNLPPYSKPQSESQCGLDENQSIDRDVTVEDHSAPEAEAEPSAPDARRGSETDIAVEADPDTPSQVARFQASQRLKAGLIEIEVDELVDGFVKARQRQRRMGRDPGPTDIGFDRYVKKAISTHCAENKEQRLRQMYEAYGLDPDRPRVRSTGRALLDARINQRLGYGRADTCTA